MMMASPRTVLRNLPSLAGPLWPFPVEEASPTPQEQFLRWLYDALDAGVSEPHAMTLSSVDAHGCPDARVLILKDLDHNGWHFATSRESAKGRQIAHNPCVALTFYWPLFGRQVRIRGKALSMGEHAGRNDFLARSPGARAVALASRQSQVLDDAADLSAAITRQKQILADRPDTPSPSWTVYAVAADSVEFWQGDRDRKHVRLSYHRDGNSWRRQMLWP